MVSKDELDILTINTSRHSPNKSPPPPPKGIQWGEPRGIPPLGMVCHEISKLCPYSKSPVFVGHEGWNLSQWVARMLFGLLVLCLSKKPSSWRSKLDGLLPS